MDAYASIINLFPSSFFKVFLNIDTINVPLLILQ